MRHKLVLPLAICLAAGCAQEQKSTLEQTQRETITEHATTEIVRDVTTAPAPVTIEVPDRSGELTRIQIPPVVKDNTTVTTAAGADSNSSASGKRVDEATWPFYIKLIGVASGLALLLGVGWLALSFFRIRGAWNTGWDWFNERATAHINRIRDAAIREKDDRVVSLLRELESDAKDLHTEGMKD